MAHSPVGYLSLQSRGKSKTQPSKSYHISRPVHSNANLVTGRPVFAMLHFGPFFLPLQLRVPHRTQYPDP